MGIPIIFVILQTMEYTNILKWDQELSESKHLPISCKPATTAQCIAVKAGDFLDVLIYTSQKKFCTTYKLYSLFSQLINLIMYVYW